MVVRETGFCLTCLKSADEIQHTVDALKSLRTKMVDWTSTKVWVGLRIYGQANWLESSPTLDQSMMTGWHGCFSNVEIPTRVKEGNEEIRKLDPPPKRWYSSSNDAGKREINKLPGREFKIIVIKMLTWDQENNTWTK